MVFVQVLSDTREIIARYREMFDVASHFLATSRGIDVKVGNMPGFDQLPKGVGGLEALELAESLDGQNIGRIEILVFPIQLFIGLVEIFFVGDGIAAAVLEVRKWKGAP